MLVFVKLGGSLITEKATPYTPRVEVIQRLAAELRHALLQQPGLCVLLGHGSGSFAHTSAAKYGIARGLRGKAGVHGFARVHHDAERLNHIVTHSLIEAGIPALPIPPSASAIAHSSRIASWSHEPLLRLLERGFLPVIYGDVLIDLSQGACVASTEALFSFLAPRLHPSRVLILGETDGVLDSEGNTIRAITRKSYRKILPFLRGSAATDVTGGMKAKVEELLGISEIAPCFILNGLKKGTLERALLGKPTGGTRIWRG